MTKSEYRRQYYLKNKEKENAKSKEYGKKWREENKEYMRQYNKEYRETNKDKLKEQKKVYYEENKEHLSLKSKERYENNKEVVKERVKTYAENHTEEVREYKRKYSKTPKGRSKKLSSSYKRIDIDKGFEGEFTISGEWIEKNIFTTSCIYCGDHNWRHLGCDRIDNTKGHIEGNIVCACGICNVERQHRNLTVEEFKVYRKNNPLPEWDENGNISNANTEYFEED